MILGLTTNESDEASMVHLQHVDKDRSFQQKWHRSKTNKDGWFTFVDAGKNQFLTVASANQLVVSGKNYIHFFKKSRFFFINLDIFILFLSLHLANFEYT